MRIVLLGATEALGQRVLSAALRDDHVVTTFVADAQVLKTQIGPHIPANVEIIEGTIDDEVRLASAIRDQDALIAAVGHASDGLAHSVEFDQIVTMAEEQMPVTARAWFLGDASLLRVPNTEIVTADLPGLAEQSQTHLMNFRRLVDCPLNWSLLCPGPMVAATQAGLTKGMRLSKNIWPVPRPAHTKWLPRSFTAKAFEKLLPSMTVTYEDVARFMLNHLSSDSDYCRMRVGIANPKT